ncbi:DUF58 domain-containing protein [bacterium]|nr:DUF58 domain-containing protein [bacterium]
MEEIINRIGLGNAQWLVQLPWLLAAVIATPLIFSAWRLRVYPSWWWALLILMSVLGSIAAILAPTFLVLTVAIDLLLVLGAAVDFIWCYWLTREGISIRRTLPKTCSQGVSVDSQLQVENRTNGILHGVIQDDLPSFFEASPSRHRLRMEPMDRLTLERELTPLRRGAFSMERVDLRLSSPLRLWNRYLTFELIDSLNVYPNLKQLSDYAILAKSDRLSLIGVQKKRRIGQDSEFERLRDYARDDNYRHIDWRSTARRGKLTVKQFQSEQSQRVIFLLDCGRMMVNQKDGFSLLDHALNATLMMSHVALSQGDSVGMLCFSDEIHSYIPPRSGKSQMNRLIHAGFDQFPRLVESRYDQAFLYLSNHCKRRSMVVLETNVIDEVNAASVVDYLSNLQGPHLPVGVLLRDRVMFDAAENSEEGDFEMYRAAAAADILLWRDQVLKDLTHRGVLVIDAFPDQLTASLVNQYLEIKAKHLL